MPKIEEHYWRNGGTTLYHGDCVQTMKLFPKESFDLAFADPPFNIGLKYDNCVDVLNKNDYLLWCHAWLVELKSVLKPTGSIYVCSGPKYQAEIKCVMDAAGFHWRSTIVWHYTFGPHQKTNFTPSWVAIHYATKDPKKWTWNRDAILAPSARQTVYGDKRAKAGGKTPNNYWLDSFEHSRICGSFKERTAHPCQMPEAVLERIIKVSSNQNDTVCDPFLGSGTTAMVCKNLGRKCIGIELSENYLDEIVVPRLR